MKLLKVLLNPSTFLAALLPPVGNNTPINCLTTSATLETLINCFDGYTVPAAYYTRTTYEEAQPNDNERDEWRDAVEKLLSVDDNCASKVPKDLIKDYYSISLFTESVSGGKSFCILSESTRKGSVYTLGWGLVVVPATRADVLRSIHFSAPHPKFDPRTPQQAAALFKATGAKSLLVTGRHRRALSEKTDCITPSDYYTTDPAHDKNEPFHDAMIKIYDWQDEQDGCPSATCAFLQMHGKSSETCSADNIFLSSGLTGSIFSGVWYTDGTDRPVKRLKTNLQIAFPSPAVIAFPTDDTECDLTATKNIFGRYANGVATADVCRQSAARADVDGKFVHAEQDSAARSDTSYAGWTTAIEDTFATA